MTGQGSPITSHSNTEAMTSSDIIMDYTKLFANNNETTFDKLFSTNFWSSLSEKSDLFILLLLRDKETKNLLFVASSHLYWDPKFPEIKTAQGHVLNYGINYETQLMYKAYKLLNNNIQEYEIKLPISNDNSVAITTTTTNTSTDKNSVPEKSKIEKNSAIALETAKIPMLLCMDANALAWKDYNDIFDPWVNETPDNMYNNGFTSGVYEYFTHGMISPDHCEHPIGRLNLRESWMKQIDNAATKEIKDKLTKKYGKAMKSWGFHKFSVNEEIEGLNEINFNFESPMIDEIKLWQSVYKEASLDNKEPEFTTKASWFEGCIDYILMTQNSLNIISYLDFERNSNTNELVRKFVPNKDNPSDHLPLVAKFSFK